MAFVDSLFPVTLAFGSRGGPCFDTSVVTTRDGAEHRNRNWRYARAQYEVGLQHKDEDTTRTLVTFYRAVAQGRLNTFLCTDPLPGESTVESELLGTGNGVATSFPLIKTYTSGGATYVRRLYRPDDALTVTVNGVGAGYTWSQSTASIVLNSAAGNGHAVRATGTFYVEVRFDTDDDRLPLTLVEPGLYSWGSIRLVEVRTFLGES